MINLIATLFIGMCLTGVLALMLVRINKTPKLDLKSKAQAKSDADEARAFEEFTEHLSGQELGITEHKYDL